VIEGLDFVLCFIKLGNQLLMLHRKNPPNQGLWNCVGGHIEKGEAPLNACIREVKEETGLNITNPKFYGVLSWRGFEIYQGGLYIFGTELRSPLEIQGNFEGLLKWQPIDWVLTSHEVVDNLRTITPYILNHVAPRLYHFDYADGVIVNSSINPLPGWVKIDKVESE